MIKLIWAQHMRFEIEGYSLSQSTQTDTHTKITWTKQNAYLENANKIAVISSIGIENQFMPTHIAHNRNI